MDTLTRLKQLMKQKKMSTYKLAQESGLPLSTITSLFHKGNCPTIPTLEGLCAGLGVTLSEFFYEPGDEIPNDDETKELLAKWNMLSLMEKKVIFDVINIVIDDEKVNKSL